MKLFLIRASAVAAVALISAAGAIAQQGQIRDPKIGLILALPAGWRVADAPAAMKLDYPIAVTTPYKGSTPNLVVTDEAFTGTPDEYADVSVRNIGKLIPDSKLISKAAFKTRGGVTGTKLVMRNTMQGAPLRQVFYLFPSNTGLMLTFTVSSPVAQGFKHDKAMDDSMRGIVLGK